MMPQDLDHTSLAPKTGNASRVLRPTPYALDSRPYALHPTPCALGLAPCALRLAPYALRSKPCALRIFSIWYRVSGI